MGALLSGSTIGQYLQSLSENRDRKRSRRAKQRRADRPLLQFLRAGLGLGIQPLPAPQPTPVATRLRRGEIAKPNANPVWVVVPSGIAYFRFVETNALAEINSAFNVTYVFPDPNGPHRIPRDLNQNVHSDLLFVPIDPERYAIWSRLFEISCRALAPRCASFRVRSEMGQASRRRKAQSGLQHLFFRMVPVLGSGLLFGLVRRNVVRALGPDPVLVKALAEDRPA